MTFVDVLVLFVIVYVTIIAYMCINGFFLVLYEKFPTKWIKAVFPLFSEKKKKSSIEYISIFIFHEKTESSVDLILMKDENIQMNLRKLNFPDSVVFLIGEKGKVTDYKIGSCVTPVFEDTENWLSLKHLAEKKWQDHKLSISETQKVV